MVSRLKRPNCPPVLSSDTETLVILNFKHERIAPTCCEAMDLVGLNLAALQHILKEIESDVTELAAVLKIDVISSKVYELIAGAIAEQLNAPA